VVGLDRGALLPGNNVDMTSWSPEQLRCGTVAVCGGLQGGVGLADDTGTSCQRAPALVDARTYPANVIDDTVYIEVGVGA
jgi:hypothetical protein